MRMQARGASQEGNTEFKGARSVVLACMGAAILAAALLALWAPMPAVEPTVLGALAPF